VALVQVQQAGYSAYQGGLAGAIGSQQCDYATLRHGQVDVF
jgi:hypothetical protein